MSAADTTLLTRQREMLLQKLDEFERTNKALRRLLREQQATEVLQSNLILYNSRWGFCSLRRCCILRLLFSVCWLLFHLPFGCEAVAGVCYDSCKVEFPCCFRCSRHFFCPFRLCAIWTSSSPGTGQVKPGFSDWRINSGRKPSLQNTDRNPLVRERNFFFAYNFLKPSSGWKILCISLQQ